MKKYELIKQKFIYSGQYDVAKLLIEHSADIHAKNNVGETALIKAAENGNFLVGKS